MLNFKKTNKKKSNYYPTKTNQSILSNTKYH